MGQVVPFIARVRDSGDWTAGERARLEDLADRLAAGGVKVEVVFGATDEGDPWCVVTDADGDVLIHVARIDGVFVVHSAVDDMVSEGVDLHAALRDRLAATEEFAPPKTADVLPFTARQAQTFLALVAATAFFYETSGIAEAAQAAEPPHPAPTHDDPPPPPAPDTDMPTHERQLATQGAALQDPDVGRTSTTTLAAVEAPAAPAAAVSEPAQTSPPSAPLEPAPQPVAHAEAILPTPAPEQAPVVIQGTAHDDQLVGTAKNEHILGEAGNDTLQGGGGADTLDGGDGDDRIEVAAGVTAEGGKGADTFVIQAPVQFGHPGVLLGVILDYSGAEGDRVMTWRGDSIKLPPHPLTDAKTDPATDWPGHPFGPTTVLDHTFDPTTLTRVEVDLDGDGVADGYILMGLQGHAVGGDDHPIVVTGRSLSPDDPIG